LHCNKPCPLYPRKRTFAVQVGGSHRQTLDDPNHSSIMDQGGCGSGIALLSVAHPPQHIAPHRNSTRLRAAW